MIKLSPTQSWSTLIKSANLYHGFSRFRLDYVIYERERHHDFYRFLFNTSSITKRRFIDYVLDEDAHREEDAKYY